MTDDGGTVAAKALVMLGVRLEEIREDIGEVLGEANGPAVRSAVGSAGGDIPFDAHARRAFKLALRESQLLGDGSVGPEHILLGMIREERSAGAVVLLARGADLARVRGEIAWIAGVTGSSARSFDFEPIGRGGLLLMVLAAIARLDQVNGRVVAVRLFLEGARDRMAAPEQDPGDPDDPDPVT
jgi:ATP-dependent Clp protease ATP-binding subunit ClpA